MSKSAFVGAPSADATQFIRPVLEWVFWITLVALYAQQTTFFDETLQNYRLGATGWPRGLCYVAIAGATGQLVSRLLAIHRRTAENSDSDGFRVQRNWSQTAQHLAIFGFPFCFLYAVPSVGFYVAAPVFILGLLLLLGVRKPRTIALVVAIVFGLFLLIFTRFFYVALPVGSIPAFYNVNVTVIEFTRYGK
ncbi:Tripartite tricarboxylate transporter TctB family protein [Tritonibacter multivorans]|uniref:Tripartite tricarboxylate transporter TctB family protein n=1 Tax=Tritonibacter multivorans TaxID=928856 RepID=A0A0P1GW29_9RHOB|nr:tripartite tricarboxylate transporter TctB family protein [Tritonibacter multivorans]MDA7422874.1 tripartite tricarboxylate transporter TctB family protein [Tritonibacter multivorans]CUH78236.1 Tripartite tricarboxylate transporter TctB family protein [Tritonibacter multivorans]SFD62696.1 Tripartite tricarboxylate transporter TctB family protein [Tritonibacter multivorans]